MIYELIRNGILLQNLSGSSLNKYSINILLYDNIRKGWIKAGLEAALIKRSRLLPPFALGYKMASVIQPSCLYSKQEKQGQGKRSPAPSWVILLLHAFLEAPTSSVLLRITD